MRLHASDSSDSRGEIYQKDPSVELLIEAINRLDGGRYAEVGLSLADFDAEGLVIYGGHLGKVIIQLLTAADGSALATAVDPTAGDEEVVVSWDGTGFPARMVVTTAVALQCAEWYLRHQQLDPRVTWASDEELWGVMK